MTETQILKEKVINRANSNMPKIEKVIQTIQSESNSTNDVLVNTRGFNFGVEDESLFINYGGQSSKIGRFALKQLAGRVGVPTRYLNSLNESEWGRGLASDILNKHVINNEPQRVLVRNVNNTVRGVLSDSYKRLDSLQVFNGFLTSALKNKAKIFDASHDETKTFIDVILPEIVEINTPNNGVVNFVVGAQIRNSDFGDGSLNIRSYIMNVVCLNGMIGTKFLNEIHRGSKLPESIRISEETYRKETDATVSLINDAMKSIFDVNNVRREADRIFAASEKKVDFDNEIVKLKRSKHFNDFELTSLTQKLKAGNIDDGCAGDNTMWKFVQGITSVANGYQNTRKNELIEYASELY